MAYAPTADDVKMLDFLGALDLRQFVHLVYPWSQVGTPLEHVKGPRGWQDEDLKEISDHVAANRVRIAKGEDAELFRKATVSGRGIGKTALMGWAAHWMMTTAIGSSTIVTANSEAQLKSRTFAEIAKWFTVGMNSHWFEKGATSIHPAPWFAEVVKRHRKIDPTYYYVDGQLWSADNPGAYAGVHNPNGLLVMFDEAAGIPKPVWTVTHGFFTEQTPYKIWMAFSQGRDNSGPFYDAHHHADPLTGKFFWRRRQLDSRTVEGVPKAELDAIIAEHGIDSDVARIEVLGQFPNQGQDQFIANSLVELAQARELGADAGAPLIMGVDVAAGGGDYTVVRFRQGPDARSIPPQRWKHPDLMVTADRVAALINEFRPDAVCIDYGMGNGVANRLNQLNYRTHIVQFGEASLVDPWQDRRTEMYAALKEWLRNGGCIDRSHDNNLFGDLTAAKYGYFGKARDKIKLEPKPDFKSRLGRSPDDGDALALTFAVKPSRRDMRTSRGPSRGFLADGLDASVFT